MTDAPIAVSTLAEAAPLLRRPFAPEAIRFKPQMIVKNGAGALCVAYIDARVVIERLNLVVPGLWETAYRSVGANLMWCDLTIDGRTRPDVGEGQGKALVSDALKRAAVQFGVGVSVRAIPQEFLWQNQGADVIALWQKTGKWEARIEPKGEDYLRQTYVKWLDDHGRAAFGEPLDHGDTAATPGDEAPADVDPDTGELVHDPFLTPEQIERVQAAFTGIGMPDRMAMYKSAGINDPLRITVSQARALGGMVAAHRQADTPEPEAVPSS